MQHAKIQSTVLDTGDENIKRPGLLLNPSISPEYRNQWTLIPRAGNGNFTEIHEYIQCILVSGNCIITPRYVPGKSITPTR